MFKNENSVGSILELKDLLEELQGSVTDTSEEILKEKSNIWRVARDQICKALDLYINAYKRLESEWDLFYMHIDDPCKCGIFQTIGAIDVIKFLAKIQEFVQKEYADIEKEYRITRNKRDTTRKGDKMKEIKTIIKYSEVAGMRIPHYIVRETETGEREHLPLLPRMVHTPPSPPPIEELIPQIIRPRKETVL